MIFVFFLSFQWDFKMVREERFSVSDIVMELSKTGRFIRNIPVFAYSW